MIFIPVNGNPQKEGYHGRGNTFPFPDNVIEIHVDDIKEMHFDCILFQSERNYGQDQYEILSEEQRQLPRIYIEHNTPGGHAVNTKHAVHDKKVMLIHVTHFNKLMWDNNDVPTKVIDHGIDIKNVIYTGEIAKGIVVINNLPKRGRIAGYDVFKEVSRHVPMDLIGMGTEGIGLGEVLHPQLPEFLRHYRFYFHPARYTSLGLSLLEAMMVGLPVVGLATTEMPTVVENGVSGFTDTNLEVLIDKMNVLVSNPNLAAIMGGEAKKTAMTRFNIKRFTDEWEYVLEEVVNRNRPNK